MSDPQDFLEFMNADGHKPSPQVWNGLDEKLQKQLFPSWHQLSLKIFFIHLLGSGISLLFCPQFGFHLIGSSHGLMGYFMKAGTWGCQILCGSFYISLTMILLNFLLKTEELKLLLTKTWAVGSVLVLSSLSFFWMMTPDIFSSLTLIWILGAMLTWILPLRLREIRFVMR